MLGDAQQKGSIINVEVNAQQKQKKTSIKIKICQKVSTTKPSNETNHYARF